MRLHLIDAQEKIVALEADHNGVCKFGESEIDQDNFNLVRAHLQLLHQKALVKSELDSLPFTLPMPTVWRNYLLPRYAT